LGVALLLQLTHKYTQLLVHFYDDYQWKIVPENFLRRGGCAACPDENRGSLSKHLHPPLVYSEFMKRNDVSLLIRVVGEEQH
jgi:hypothetical protein